MHIGLPQGQRRAHDSGRIGGQVQIFYYNWSGYADDNSNGNVYTMVSGAWTQPVVACAKEQQIAVFWVGLDGFSSSTVEQVGTLAFCFQGLVHYYSWWEMYPTNSIQLVATINAGDKISGSVTFATGSYQLKLTDATTPAGSFSTTQTCGAGQTCSNSSAEWIVERPTFSWAFGAGLFPLPNFHSWSLSSAKVKSGTTTGVIKTFPDDVINMVFNNALDNSQYNLATPGALNTAGNGFKDSWVTSF